MLPWVEVKTQKPVLRKNDSVIHNEVHWKPSQLYLLKNECWRRFEKKMNEFILFFSQLALHL